MHDIDSELDSLAEEFHKSLMVNDTDNVHIMVLSAMAGVAVGGAIGEVSGLGIGLGIGGGFFAINKLKDVQPVVTAVGGVI